MGRPSSLGFQGRLLYPPGQAVAGLPRVPGAAVPVCSAVELIGRCSSKESSHVGPGVTPIQHDRIRIHHPSAEILMPNKVKCGVRTSPYLLGDPSQHTRAAPLDEARMHFRKLKCVMAWSFL